MDLYICRFPQLDGVHAGQLMEGSIWNLRKLKLKPCSCDFLETQEDDRGSRVGGHKENTAAQPNGLELH